jgi:hypothetical protein
MEKHIGNISGYADCEDENLFLVFFHNFNIYPFQEPIYKENIVKP